MRRALVRVLLACASIVLLLLVLEVALQIAAHFVRPELAHITPQSGATRILCIGDSNTYGLHLVSELQSYPAQLDRRLHQLPSPRFQVENRGVPGYATGQMRAFLPHWLDELGPQVVIILGGINDTWNASRPGWLERSRLYRFASIALSRLRGSERFRLEQVDASHLQVKTGSKTSLVQSEGAAGSTAGDDLLRVVAGDLRAMVGLVRQAGAQPVLMTYPTEAEMAFVTVNEAARQVSRELAVPLVDHALAFREPCLQRGYEALMFASDHHPNGQGYALMVDGILAKFLELGWIAEIPPLPPTPAAQIDERVTLERTGESSLRLVARPGLRYVIALAPRSVAPTEFASIQLPQARDVPQLQGVIGEQGEEMIRIPAALLASRPLYARAFVYDGSWRMRGWSEVLTLAE
jgi:lysophospholipase L1-like esterase